MLQSASPGRGCLVPGGAWSGGMGCLLPGGCLLQGGVCSRGEGGAWSGGCVPGLGGVSQHALRQTPLPPIVDRHTLVNILPWPNFVAAGNKKASR